MNLDSVCSLVRGDGLLICMQLHSTLIFNTVVGSLVLDVCTVMVCFISQLVWESCLEHNGWIAFEKSWCWELPSIGLVNHCELWKIGCGYTSLSMSQCPWFDASGERLLVSSYGGDEGLWYLMSYLILSSILVGRVEVSVMNISLPSSPNMFVWLQIISDDDTRMVEMYDIESSGVVLGYRSTYLICYVSMMDKVCATSSRGIWREGLDVYIVTSPSGSLATVSLKMAFSVKALTIVYIKGMQWKWC